MKNGSDFIFESVDLWSYTFHKIGLKRGKSYIKTPEWVGNKRVTMNKNNKDNKCFQYSITVATNHQNIENAPERISNIELFINQYNWKSIDLRTGIKDCKKFERSNKTIALNILSIPQNTKTINLAYNSKYNRKRKNQVALLMITNGEQINEAEKCLYIALKSPRTADGFNRPIRSLGCLHSFRTDNGLKRHERLCDDNDYCHLEMPTKDNKTLKCNDEEKS